METPPRRRFRITTLIIVLAALAFCAAAVVVAVVASGDDSDSDGNGDPIASATPGPDAGPLNEYADGLLDLGTELDNRVVELQTQLTEDLTNEDDEAARLVLVKQNFIDIAAANTTFVTALEDVSPPESVEQPHAEMVSAGQTYVAALDDAGADLETAATFEDAQAIILDPALEEQHSAFVDECAALVDAVEAQGTELAIFC